MEDLESVDAKSGTVDIVAGEIDTTRPAGLTLELRGGNHPTLSLRPDLTRLEKKLRRPISMVTRSLENAIR